MKTSRFSNDLNDTSLHTSGFAEVANGDGLGVTSTQSFTQRRQVEQQRKIVRSYRDSLVGRAYGERRAIQPGQRLNRQSQSTRQEMNSTPPSPGFREPPARTYNPFG